jgi:tetratricopeptide (TPR) repeat protein
VTAASPEGNEPVRLEFDRALADREMSGNPTNSGGHWTITGSGEGQNCTAFWSLSKPVSLELNASLTFELQFMDWNGVAQNLGRFRLSVSSDPKAFDREQKRLAAMQLTDPWAKLAATYHLIGDQPALEKLVKQHSAAAVCVADLYAADRDWERAIAEYSKLITDQTAGANVLAKRAKAYEAVQRWDLARADWRRAIEQQPGIAQAAFDSFRRAERWSEAAEFGLMLTEQKPQDSLLWMQIAPVLVLAGDDADYPAYCRRIIERFVESKDFDVPDKVVKACLLRPEDFELAMLPVGKFAAPLDEGSAPDWFPVWAWGTRALLAYRSGDAESAAKYVARSEELKPNDFAHALNLAVLAMAQHQLRHLDEARRALKEAEQVTGRLQGEASNKGDSNLLIAQILLREAEALIHGKPKPKPNKEEPHATGAKTP